jgi:hypothetical protein
MATLKPLDTSKLESKLAWERPERKDQAGKLALFGGVSLKLKEVDTIFQQATKYGVGSAVALVPESLAKVFKRKDQYLVPVILDHYFGLTDAGLETVQEELFLTNALILADIGNSSATGLRLAKVVSNSFKTVIISDSSATLAISYPNEILANPNVVLVLNLQNLQKIIQASKIKLSGSLNSTQSFQERLKLLAELNTQISAKIILSEDKRVVAVESDSFLNLQTTISQLELCANLAAWRVWAPQILFLEQLFAAAANL